VKWIVFLLALGGCTKRATPAAEDAGWHPYKNVAPERVKKQLEDINTQHENQLDNQIDKANQQ
jgi:hypothetical protein